MKRVLMWLEFRMVFRMTSINFKDSRLLPRRLVTVFKFHSILINHFPGGLISGYNITATLRLGQLGIFWDSIRVWRYRVYVYHGIKLKWFLTLGFVWIVRKPGSRTFHKLTWLMLFWFVFGRILFYFKTIFSVNFRRAIVNIFIYLINFTLNQTTAKGTLFLDLSQFMKHLTRLFRCRLIVLFRFEVNTAVVVWLRIHKTTFLPLYLFSLFRLFGWFSTWQHFLLCLII